jgi:hypothetical protein
MPGFSLERNGLVNFDQLGYRLAKDLCELGSTLTPAFVPFRLVSPSTLPTEPPAGILVLESTAAINPTNDTANPANDHVPPQAWRMRIDTTNGLKINVATPLQIDDAGRVTKAPWDETLTAGALGDLDAAQEKLVDYDKWGIATSLDVDPIQGTTNWPLSYRLTVSDRGMAFYCWGEALTKEWRPTTSWFLIQRPVHPDTGAVLIKGKAPLFCIYSRTGGGVLTGDTDLFDERGICQFVVRELDINVPRRSFSAVKHTIYGNAIINPTRQIAFTEDREFIVTFPNGLTTSRYAYIHEIDMLAYTSADVIPCWTVAELSMYGETTKRKYVAMPANGPRDTLMRPLILIDGGGVTNLFPDPSVYVGTR